MQGLSYKISLARLSSRRSIPGCDRTLSWVRWIATINKLLFLFRRCASDPSPLRQMLLYARFSKLSLTQSATVCVQEQFVYDAYFNIQAGHLPTDVTILPTVYWMEIARLLLTRRQSLLLRSYSAHLSPHYSSYRVRPPSCGNGVETYDFFEWAGQYVSHNIIYPHRVNDREHTCNLITRYDGPSIVQHGYYSSTMALMFVTQLNSAAATSQQIAVIDLPTIPLNGLTLWP